MNHWNGIGRLVRDVEVKGDGDKKVAKYTLAVDRKYSKGEEKQADFISCVCFGKSAEFAEKYFSKGKKVAVTGRIQTGSYVNKDNQKVYTTDIVVEEQEFCESKGAESKPTNNAPVGDGDFMELSAESVSDMPF